MIICIEKEKGALLAVSNTWDTDFLSECDYVCDENLPIRKNENGGILGCFSVFNGCTDALIHDDAIWEMAKSKESILRDMIPAIRETVERTGFLENDTWRNTLTLFVDGKIYDISVDFLLFERKGDLLHCIYADFGYAVLAENRGKPAEERIMDFVEKFRKETHNDLYPLALLDTVTGEKRVVYAKEDLCRYY